MAYEGAYLSGINEVFEYRKFPKNSLEPPHHDNRFLKSFDEIGLLTVHIYLNDVKQGGSTKFFKSNLSNGNYKCRAKEGKMLIFRAEP